MVISLREPCDNEALSVEEIRALEIAIAERSTPLDELMRRAGASLSQYARSACPAAESVLILCGSGNNGGDGWVVACELARMGSSVKLITPRETAHIKAEPAATEAEATMRAIECEGLPLTILVNPDERAIDTAVSQSDIVIDAILGTGFNGETVKEPYRTWIEIANHAHGLGQCFHLACDIPSGLAADTGAEADIVFAADATVTMIAPKLCMTGNAVNSHLGSIVVADLEHPVEL